MTDEVILRIEDVDVSYGDFRAIHDVTMDIRRGSITSLIGANGAGKSTLLDAVMGINKPQKGKIIFNGEDITGMRTSMIVRKGITMAPEGSMIFEGMSVKENLLMGAYIPEKRKKKEELIERVFTLFPVLKEKEKQLASFLSGGQRQMLAIARAIMSDPKMIICDEISLGLAPVIIGDIFERVHEINGSGVTFLIVDQEVHRSLENSNYSYVMVKGGVVMSGASAELPEDEVKDAFFGINKYA
ncbi:ABC transporter ATP-binding protein [Parasporobacterium paucivorans]|uniref:Branched-chain amino acid transport system ATP-binding protein n=1 Tax=Parasporobacterium paucivorans DSM 15970 TaxID=1122934 RepID=A0A1M6E4N3_9FIRM|nr:ABC transporter ATP-binding protein [Parasporobacterium paucivorans]SHI80363.1 branched-chain amino acid transport system ATP-binding protein [Parasporobacterium paucivorans DSM 15970]